MLDGAYVEISSILLYSTLLLPWRGEKKTTHKQKTNTKQKTQNQIKNQVPSVCQLFSVMGLSTRQKKKKKDENTIHSHEEKGFDYST